MHFHIEYVLNVLNWLLITICFLPFESSWGAHPSETDNFIFWFCYEMEARARGEELKMKPSSTWPNIFSAYLTVNGH